MDEVDVRREEGGHGEVQSTGLWEGLVSGAKGSLRGTGFWTDLISEKGFV